jgi:hypothetical protein
VRRRLPALPLDESAPGSLLRAVRRGAWAITGRSRAEAAGAARPNGVGRRDKWTVRCAGGPPIGPHQRLGNASRRIRKGFRRNTLDGGDSSVRSAGVERTPCRRGACRCVVREGLIGYSGRIRSRWARGGCLFWAADRA